MASLGHNCILEGLMNTVWLHLITVESMNISFEGHVVMMSLRQTRLGQFLMWKTTMAPENVNVIYRNRFVYWKTCNINHIIVGNKIVDHSDVVGASPVGQLHFYSGLITWHQWNGQKQLQDKIRNTWVLVFLWLILEVWWYLCYAVYVMIVLLLIMVLD